MTDKPATFPRRQKWYVLHQQRAGDDASWCIVDRSGPGEVPEAVRPVRPPIGGYDPTAEPEAAMQESAAERTRYVRTRAGEDAHVLFLAMAADEVVEMGLGRLIGVKA